MTLTEIRNRTEHNAPQLAIGRGENFMRFDTTLTETDLDPAAREFAKQLREQGVNRQVDFGVDGFQEPLGQRVLRLFGIKKE